MHLDIWIDADPSSSAAPNPAVAAVAQRASASWPFGTCTVHARAANVGLRAQWLQSWAGSTRLSWRTREIALFLEDDLQLSPWFWRWLKAAHAAYAKRPDVAGFSLQRAALCAADGCPSGRVPPNGTGPFMYPLVGSWGFSPTLRHWRRFTRWAARFMESGEKPYVSGVVTTRWYREFEAAGRCPGRNCMWTALHVKYVATHTDRYTVYARPRRKLAALAVNHQEPGLHYRSKQGRDARLVRKWEESLERFPEKPLRVGWDGKPAKEERFVEVARELATQWEGVIFVQFLDANYVEMTKHWICNVRKLEGNILKRTLIIALDDRAYVELNAFAALLAEKVNVVLAKTYEGETVDVEQEKVYGQVGYYMMMLRRTEMILSLLFANVDVLLVEADAVWFRNPLSQIVTLASQSDIALMDDDPPNNSPQGGFMMIRANPATRDAFYEILLRQEEQLRPYSAENRSHDIGEEGNEQYIEALVLKKKSRQGKVSVKWLPSSAFISGVYYSQRALREREGYSVILFNWIVGTSAKISRAKEHGHWHLHENRHSCVW